MKYKTTFFKASFLLILLLISAVTLSSCGMKRALTLPPRDGEVVEK